MPINVYTTGNSEVCSRQELLNWVNSLLGRSYRKLEELSDGVSYCQLLNMLFADCIPTSRVKKTARLETEKLANWKLIQSAFKKLAIDKSVPAEKLIKARFLDNLEFAQWFKCFFDANCAEGQTTPTRNPDTNATLSLNNTISNDTIVTGEGNANLTQDITPGPKVVRPRSNVITESRVVERSMQSNETIVMSKANSSLVDASMQLDALAQDLEIAVRERQFYYDKLRRIEIILDKFDIETNPLASQICEVLYEVEDGFIIPDNDDPQQQIL